MKSQEFQSFKLFACSVSGYMQNSQHIVIPGVKIIQAPSRIKIKVKELNPMITCKLCNGYLINAATITECLHTFCKSCLMRHIELVNRCPTCNTVIHQTQPLYNIRLDRTMQDIVYSLLPKLEKEEKKREQRFYRSRGVPYPHHKTQPQSQPQMSKSSPSNPTKEDADRMNEVRSLHRTEEQISLQLELESESTHSKGCYLEPLTKKFIRCSTHVTVALLQRFLATKLNLESENMVGIIFDKTEMGKDFTLKYINETFSLQKDLKKPLVLHYRAVESYS